MTDVPCNEKNRSSLVSVCLAALGLMWTGEVLAQSVHPTTVRRSERLAVAWDDTESASGRVALMSTRAPWELVTPALEVGPHPQVRAAGGRLFVVSQEEGTLLVVDPVAWRVLDGFDLGQDSRPVDVALGRDDRAYVTRADATHLLRLDLQTGVMTEVVDLSPFAGADGVPDLGMMIRHEGRLFVTVRRVDTTNPLLLIERPYLAVVDLATETLIDVDPMTAGVQAIELAGTSPKQKMQIVPATRRLFVAATGAFFDEGGLEMVDLDSLVTLGLVVAEADSQVGADLGAFALVTPNRGFLAFSTDWALSSHLSQFTLDGAVEPVPDLYGALGYFAPALVFAPGSRCVFFPEAGYAPPGVQVFDADTGERLTSAPVATTGPPSDLELVRMPVRAASLEPR